MCVWVALAWSRRLNFDETLALRSGWLALGGTDGGFPFWMPWSFLLGIFSHAFSQPLHVFVASRTMSVATLLISLGFAVRHDRLLGFGTVMALCLSQSDFVHHALEFRYDSGVLAGVLVAIGCLRSPSPKTYLLLGSVVAWLFFHHLKGLYYAVCLIPLAAVGVGKVKDRSLLLGRMAVGFCASYTLWIAISLFLGRLSDIWVMYRFYGDLALPPAGLNLRSLVENPAWWTVVGLCTGIVSARLIRRLYVEGPEIIIREGGASAALALCSLVVALVHPASWPYLIATPVVLLAVSLVQNYRELVRLLRPRVAGAFALLCAIIQWEFTWVTPYDAYRYAWTSTWDFQVQGLNYLRKNLQEGETVLDPSGIAYFGTPCFVPWYSDMLLTSLVEDGRWMNRVDEKAAMECDWLLVTGRLVALPASIVNKLPQGYPPEGGRFGAAIRRNVKWRTSDFDPSRPVEGWQNRFESYWAPRSEWRL